MTNTTIATLEAKPNTLLELEDAEILQYLRHSYKFAEIYNLAAETALVVKLCEQLGIQVTDQEWQAAGDTFRLEHKLLGIQETQDWLQQQRISVEDWSEGIKLQLLKQKLIEHLFGANVDMHYISNRDQYRRVALSQILVLDREQALAIMRSLKEDHASFCALALEHSQGKQSHFNGGFVGVRYLSEFMPEIIEAISDVPVGEIIGPIQTKLGYHIVRVEKWFPTQMNESVREQILSTLWQVWLKEQH
jgi:parvulin-like peptidyl-prolyl isomerase